MNSVVRFRLLVAMGMLGCMVCVAFSQRPEPNPTPAVARGQNATTSQPIGMAGCASTGCHGRGEYTVGTMPTDMWHESFTRWIDRDPHTRAYAVLDSDLGRAIMTRLNAGNPNLPKDATRDSRCLACHSNPSLATESMVQDVRLDRLRSEGVSCESCHGNAESWQIAHTAKTTPSTRAQELASYHMNDLNDWTNQARNCVGCHVGAPADPDRGYPVRDMNHDMIAAGHPRLEFDFARYHQKLPKHWRPRHRGTPETDPGSDSLLHAWLIGETIVEEAYCALSLDRIARGQAGDSRTPLPELSDWNCSQCHHSLTPATWREQAVKAQIAGKNPQRKLGKPAWIGASAILPDLPTSQIGQPFRDQVATLQQRLQRLDSIRQGLTTNPVFRQKLQEFLTGTHSDYPLNWEEATREYLALQSLHEALQSVKAEPTPQIDRELSQLRESLWGQSSAPPRREYRKDSPRSYPGYQRKPESRWLWETGVVKRENVENLMRSLRESLASEVKKLPDGLPKP